MIMCYYLIVLLCKGYITINIFHIISRCMSDYELISRLYTFYRPDMLSVQWTFPTLLSLY